MEIISKFTEDEQEILDMFLEQSKSIREIAEKKPGFGRTKISNILTRYGRISDENRDRVLIARHNQKNHTNVTKTEQIDTKPLEEEQIQWAYRKIILEDATLTEVSATLGKNRETVKKAIIDFLDDKTEIDEFNKKLKENQNINPGEKTKNFLELQESERKEAIFRRLNNRRKARGRTLYSTELLERKYNRLLEYFESRASKNEDVEKLSMKNIQCMMYEYPTLLSMSLSSKIKPVIDMLDNECLGYGMTNKVLKDNPSILGTAISRIKLQIRILDDSGNIKYAIKRPRVFRTSPELMYALVKESALKARNDDPFIVKQRIPGRYGVTAEELIKRHDITTEYGDDEYFDGR